MSRRAGTCRGQQPGALSSAADTTRWVYGHYVARPRQRAPWRAPRQTTRLWALALCLGRELHALGVFADEGTAGSCYPPRCRFRGSATGREPRTRSLREVARRAALSPGARLMPVLARSNLFGAQRRSDLVARSITPSSALAKANLLPPAGLDSRNSAAP